MSNYAKVPYRQGGLLVEVPLYLWRSILTCQYTRMTVFMITLQFLCGRCGEDNGKNCVHIKPA